MKAILIIILAVLSAAALGLCIVRAKRENSSVKRYWRYVYGAIAASIGCIAAFGLSLDLLVPERHYTFEELNSDAGSGVGWIAGGIFLVCAAAFGYYAYRKVHKNN